MKVYSYVLQENRGLAPNPFWDFCTLALDQALIRQIAEIGDWVVGLKEISRKIEDHALVFAMQITEKLTYDEYWNNPRFQIKRPDFAVGEEIFRVGDNIYEPSGDGFVQNYSYRSKDYFESEEAWKARKHEDLQGKYVLVSGRKHYYYFGKEAVKLPSVELLDLLYCDVGYKCIADPDVPQEFLDFLNKFKKEEKIGFITPPEDWPIDDESFIQCVLKDD
jgi:hypothetical protein